MSGVIPYDPRPLDEAIEANDAALSTTERKALIALHNLSKRWPKTLTLISMGGTLHVVRTGDPRLNEPYSQDRQHAIIQTFDGIPNDGGDW